MASSEIPERDGVELASTPPSESNSDPASRPQQLMPLRTALIQSTGAGLAFVGMLFVLFYLLIGHPHLSHEPLTSDALFNLLKLAFAVVAGIGATVALVMNYRKQRLAEIKAEQETGAEARAGRVELREQDKLFTERFTQAAQQLGNERAAVRLAGTYVLARIADDSVRDRPTCLKVLCAYLRMPYEVDADSADDGERQVRVTAQSLVAERLRPDHPGFWRDAQLDLDGACLIDAVFDRCAFAHASFKDARFIGNVSFKSVAFESDVSFEKASFRDDATFDGSTFACESSFIRASFQAGASFLDVTFEGAATFEEATFSATAQFHNTGFGAMAVFEHAKFEQDADFDAAVFTATRFVAASFEGCARFREAEFTEAAMFSGAGFGLEAQFNRTRFDGDAWFNGARFAGKAHFDETQFAKDAWFRKSAFADAARFKTSRFGNGAWFNAAAFHGPTRFDNAVFVGGARFSNALFSGPAWFDTAEFNSEARFDLAQFERPVRFDRASFSENHPPVWPSSFAPT